MPQTAPIASIDSTQDDFGLLITQHIDQVFRVVMPGPGVEIEPEYIRLVTGEPHPFGNFICMSHPATAPGTTKAMEPLLHCNAPAAAFFAGPLGDDVHQTLVSHGFERAGGMPAMAVEIDKLPATTLPDGYRFERVSSQDHRDVWGDVFARGYELPPRLGAAFSGGISGDDAEDARIQYFWVLKGDTPVCTSFIYLNKGVAGVYGVATLPEERGKGLGAHVTAEPLRMAHKLGYRVGVLQSSEAGYPIYKRIGFSDFGEIPLYVRMPS